MLISASIGLLVRILLYATKIEGSIKQTTGIAIPKIPTDPAIMPSDVMGIPTQQIGGFRPSNICNLYHPQFHNQI